MHGYQDQFFQGYIQNLFYPPLEDFILATAYATSGYRHLLAFKIYSSKAELGRLFVEVIEPTSVRFSSDRGGREFPPE